MASGKPSMIALLGLLAVAGFKHREKISQVLENARGRVGGSSLGVGSTETGGSFLEELKRQFTESPLGETLSSGLSEVVARLREVGRAEEADSWVAHGPNRAVDVGDLERGLGDEILTELSEKTGLSRAEIVERLSRELPPAVDYYTSDGRIPTTDEAAGYV